MESLIQQTLDDFVESTTREIVGGISTFSIQANAVINAAVASAGSVPFTSPAASKLKEMQFAQPRTLVLMILKDLIEFLEERDGS
jgi:hypothetical protein